MPPAQHVLLHELTRSCCQNQLRLSWLPHKPRRPPSKQHFRTNGNRLFRSSTSHSSYQETSSHEISSLTSRSRAYLRVSRAKTQLSRYEIYNHHAANQLAIQAIFRQIQKAHRRDRRLTIVPRVIFRMQSKSPNPLGPCPPTPMEQRRSRFFSTKSTKRSGGRTSSPRLRQSTSPRLVPKIRRCRT